MHIPHGGIHEEGKVKLQIPRQAIEGSETKEGKKKVASRNLPRPVRKIVNRRKELLLGYRKTTGEGE